MALGAAESAEPFAFLAYVEAWLGYLPLIYPVGIQLARPRCTIRRPRPPGATA